MLRDPDRLDVSGSRLTSSVTKWAGLADGDPKVAFNGLNVNISVVNDGEGDEIQPQDFNTIADIIEAQL